MCNKYLFINSSEPCYIRDGRDHIFIMVKAVIFVKHCVATLHSILGPKAGGGFCIPVIRARKGKLQILKY